MSAPNAAAATSRHAPAGINDRRVHARELAAQFSKLFDQDVEIVKRLNDAHHRLQQASERL